SEEKVAMSGEDFNEYRASTDPLVRDYESELKALRKHLLATVGVVDEVMVMEEMEKPRETFVLVRGEYDAHGERVEPGTPEAVLPYPKDLPRNRLGLAEWIIDEKNPLPARVTVNR